MRPGDTEQFFRSTRGRIVLLLMGTTRTVSELADELEVSDNAVRAHLVAMERDGVVRQSGERRSGGRPAHLYEVTPAADDLFPKAYDEGLVRLLERLAERLEGTELHELLAAAGRDAVAGPGSGDPWDRIEAAVEALEARGGVVEADLEDGVATVRSACCVLSGVVGERPAACHLVRGMVEAALGAEAEVCCQLGARPTCRFRARVAGEE